MPQTSQSLYTLVLSILLYAVAFSAAAVFVRGRFGRRALWVGWGALAVYLSGFMAANLATLGGPSGAPTWTWFLMALPMVAIPTAGAAWAVDRQARREPRPGAGRQFFVAIVWFLCALPLGLVVGALPELARMF